MRLGSFAALREKKKKMSPRPPRRTGQAAKKVSREDQDLFAAWRLCERLIKKTLAKKDRIQAGSSFFRAKAQRPARRGGRKEI